MRPVRKADNLPPSCAAVTKSGSLNFLEPSAPLQDWFTFTFYFFGIGLKFVFWDRTAYNDATDLIWTYTK